MQILGQRDSRWGNILLGFSNTYIKDYGCTITSLAMIIGTTPDVVNARLKAVNGFASGNLVIWAKIPEAFPGIKIERVWSYNNDDVKNSVPNVLVEVPPNAIGGVSGKHWVVFIGNQECHDPWTGSRRPTNDFLKYGSATGYCKVTGKWENPTSATITIDAKLYEDLVRDATLWKDEHPKTLHLLSENERVNKEKDVIITNLNKEIDELNSDGKELADEIFKLKAKLEECESTPVGNCQIFVDKLKQVNVIANSSWLTWLRARNEVKDITK